MQDARIQALTDREAIRDLRIRYGRALDERDWKSFEALFTPEVDADFSAWGIAAGRVPRAALTAMMKPAFHREEMKSQQLYSNFVIELQGDHATSISMLRGAHHLPGLDGGEDFVLYAEYHDRLARTVEGWRIAGLRLRVLFTTGNLAVIQ